MLSVCMWIANWRDVMRFAAGLSLFMLLESNGTDEQQAAQRCELEAIYRTVTLVRETSEDDPGQKQRRLLLAMH
jgi:hypothetical protein